MAFSSKDSHRRLSCSEIPNFSMNSSKATSVLLPLSIGCLRKKISRELDKCFLLMLQKNLV